MRLINYIFFSTSILLCGCTTIAELQQDLVSTSVIDILPMENNIYQLEASAYTKNEAHKKSFAEAQDVCNRQGLKFAMVNLDEKTENSGEKLTSLARLKMIFKCEPY
ncbi:hypothetical protein KCM76_23450 [Zooshikella marina]|uniref:hypothetical protein n=1 Tax=Zooshikella ganghwensis TaxID=202772 RepID=UPI001BB00998|nr:hypothetical protein [Zooshikella ganghwensis]MBU2708971.1 hypothetical protein [Zooshikella ganghwensis]